MRSRGKRDGISGVAGTGAGGGYVPGTSHPFVRRSSEREEIHDRTLNKETRTRRQRRVHRVLDGPDT